MNILTNEIDKATQDNESWNAPNFPEGSDNPPLTTNEIEEKRRRKIAYTYDDITKFKIFMGKHPTTLKSIMEKEINFIQKMDTFVNAEENKAIMTAEMQAYIDKHQIFHRRLRRDGIDATKKPEETGGA